MKKILIKVLNKFKILSLFNVIGIIHLNDERFKIPVIQKVGFSNLFMSEPWMIDILKIVLPIDGKNFIDVGANIGQTLLKLRSVSSKINYIGFEPNPICVNYISKLIEENNFSNTQIIPSGISDKNEIGVLKYCLPTAIKMSAGLKDKTRYKIC